jgi:two-component sensor histidine kinase
MLPEIITLIDKLGYPGAMLIGMWYIMRHQDTRNAEKDALIYQILKEGQTRVESLVTMVMQLSKEDTETRSELKSVVSTMVESLQQMREFCGKGRQ